MYSKSFGWTLSLVTVIAVAAWATGATAQSGMRSLPEQSKMSVSPEIGTSFNVGGDFVKGASETITGAFSSPGLTITAGAGFTTESRDFSEVFDQPIVVGLGVNYGLSSSGEIFGRVRFVRASSDEFDTITVNIAGTISGTAFAVGGVAQGEFDDYKEIGLDVGYRHFFNPGNSFRPFLSVSGG